MLKFIRIRGENIDLDVIIDFTDEQLADAYFDLKSEQVNVNGRIGDLRIDRNYDRVREAGLASASRHIAFGLEFVSSLRRARRVKLSDRFMNKAREILAPDVFEFIKEAASVDS
jgi:hypothetical protein